MDALRKWAFVGSLTAATMSVSYAASDNPTVRGDPDTAAYYSHHHNYGHHYYGYGGNYGGYYYPQYYCYYTYAYGTVCYYARTTADNFTAALSNDADHQLEQRYLAAADDAANFVQNGGEVSPALRSALDSERAMLLKSGVQDASRMTDMTLASIVLARVAELEGARHGQNTEGGNNN